MQLSAPDWCFYREHYGADEYYRRLRDIGISAVEMTPTERWQSARDAGLPIIDIGAPGMPRGINNAANHAVLLPQLRDAISGAGEAGIPQLIIFSGNREGRSDAEGAADCITALRTLAPAAEAAGIILLFEVLSSLDHPDYQADHTAFGVEVVRGVQSPAVKLLYDAYHMFRMGEDVLADVLAHLDIIGHIHLAQSPRRTAPLAGGPARSCRVHSPAARGGLSGIPGDRVLPAG